MKFLKFALVLGLLISLSILTLSSCTENIEKNDITDKSFSYKSPHSCGPGLKIQD